MSLQSLTPGWGREAAPNAGSPTLVPLSLLAPGGPGLRDGTAARTLTRRHAGTLSYHKVKIKE